MPLSTSISVLLCRPSKPDSIIDALRLAHSCLNQHGFTDVFEVDSTDFHANLMTALQSSKNSTILLIDVMTTTKLENFRFTITFQVE